MNSTHNDARLRPQQRSCEQLDIKRHVACGVASTSRVLRKARLRAILVAQPNQFCLQLRPRRRRIFTMITSFKIKMHTDRKRPSLRRCRDTICVTSTNDTIHLWWLYVLQFSFTRSLSKMRQAEEKKNDTSQLQIPSTPRVPDLYNAQYARDHFRSKEVILKFATPSNSDTCCTREVTMRLHSDCREASMPLLAATSWRTIRCSDERRNKGP